MTGRILPYGAQGLLIELDSLDDVMRLHHALAAEERPGVVDLVPGARTIGLTVDPERLSIASAREWVAQAEAPELPAASTDEVTIDVHYDGADLADVARTLRLTEHDVVALHTASVWRVAFTGFAPGFGYLITDHDRLRVPRRDRARTSVPAGSVALAGEFSGVYPRSSPGGWQLIGTTDAELWMPQSRDPALLAPGRTVRFREAS